MKRIFTLSSLAVGILLVVFSSGLTSEPAKPPKSKTGAPGEGNCTDCHTGTPNNGGSGFVSIAFSGADNKYQSTKTYTITVTVSDPDNHRYGFEITSLDANNLKAGTPTLIDPSITATLKGMGRTYVCNYTGSSTGVWTYSWKAPKTSAGPITFYAAGNATNYDHTNQGDHAYTTTLTVDPKTNFEKETLGDASSAQAFECYPIPATDEVTVNFFVEESNQVEVSLYDMQGRLTEQLFNAYQDAGSHQHTLNFNKSYEAGMYLLVLRNGETTSTRKIILR